MTAAVVGTRRVPSWDQAVILGLAASVMLMRRLPFVRDWGPFLMLLLGYEYLRGLVPALDMQVNVLPLIEADRAMFGGLPVLDLQRLPYEPDRPGALAYAATFFWSGVRGGGARGGDAP